MKHACSHCGKRYATAAKLKDHEKLHHLNQKDHVRLKKYFKIKIIMFHYSGLQYLQRSISNNKKSYSSHPGCPQKIKILL
jgi:predicted nucleic acid-binding Zn ribbon protein